MENTVSKTQRIEDLEAEVDRLKDIIAANRRMFNLFEETLKTAVSDEAIDSELAQEFADIFGFAMTTTYSFEVTATFTGSVEVPLGEDFDDFEGYLSASLEVEYGGGAFNDFEWSTEDVTVTNSWES